MTRSRYKIFETEFPYFLTCTVVGWLPIFTRPETVQIIFDSWRFLYDHDRLVVYGYVILENHLHMVADRPRTSPRRSVISSPTRREASSTFWKLAKRLDPESIALAQSSP